MSTISVITELDRYALNWEYSGKEHIKCICPFHEDKTPSCSVSITSGQFKCFACGKSGDIITLLAGSVQKTREVVYADLCTRYDLDTTANPIDIDVIERYHQAIWKAEPLLMELRKRGISEETIRRYRLGENKGRVQIPIPLGDVYVNIRKYRPGAPAGEKMRNSSGRGKMRLYPEEQLKYETLILCGGEIKALAVAQRLNDKAIGAISTTGGEGNWEAEFTAKFANKIVYVCYDIDTTGKESADYVAAILKHVAKEVYIVDLSKVISIDKYPHGDVNDFINEGGNAERLINDLAAPYVPKTFKKRSLDEAKPTNFANAYCADKVMTRVEVRAILSAVDRSPYMLPKKVRVFCDKDQKVCTLCPVYRSEDKPKYELDDESAKLVELAGAPDSKKASIIKQVIGIPERCKSVGFNIEEHVKMEDARISPQIEVSSLDACRTMQPVCILGDFEVEANRTVKITGTVVPNPNNQVATIVASGYELVEDVLADFENQEVNDLKAFQANGIDVAAKLDEIYTDFEDNITKVVCRRPIHLAIDLAYHSPLFLNIADKQIKGWAEVLILGDSSQGKSETLLNLMRHYELGEKVECKNATVAGLLGGVQQLSNNSRWFVTWGAIPTHDRRLVALEELKGASTKIISQLTDMRSSGIAELDKIEKRKTHARTRLIFVSNPREEARQISSYSFGIDAVRELFGHLEDVRRLDYAVIVSSDDVNETDIRAAKDRKKVEHIYTSTLCKKLILWVWTRTAEQIQFEDVKHLADIADALCKDYVEAIPLIDKGSMVYKLARLAASLACRLFSTLDGKNVIVKREHVEHIDKLLRDTYNHQNFGYDLYTKATRIAATIKDPDSINQLLSALPYPQDFIDQILYKDKFDVQDVQDWSAWERQQASELISLLVRKQAIVREGRTYYKTPGFVTYLRSIDVNNLTPPKHVKEDDTFR